MYIFHVRLVCRPYHVRSASDRGKGKGQIAISILIRITEKGTEHFLRIAGFKPTAKRTQNPFNIRFESIKLKRRKRLTVRQHEKLISVERDPNKKTSPFFVRSILTNRQNEAQLLSRKNKNLDHIRNIEIEQLLSRKT